MINRGFTDAYQLRFTGGGSFLISFILPREFLLSIKNTLTKFYWSYFIKNVILVYL